MNKLFKSVIKSLRWLVLAAMLYLSVELGFALMNTASTICFFLGIGTIIVAIILTIHFIKLFIKQSKTNENENN